MSIDIIQGEARAVLEGLPAASVHTCITSPPYFGLRSYGGPDQEIGTEETPAAYVAHLVEMFRAVHRVLRPDGTCWIVLGDSFNAAGRVGHGTRQGYKQGTNRASAAGQDNGRANAPDLKPKDLLMIPHRVALALQADGWYVRNDCVWAKGSAMPASVQDRFSRAHEYVFHLAKSERYYFDPIAVAEQAAQPLGQAALTGQVKAAALQGLGASTLGSNQGSATRNRRSVLHINPQPFSAADFGLKDIDHYAVFPEKLVEILTLCSTSEAGCCPRCAAPWLRVVERTGHVNGREAAHQPGNTPTKTDSTGWAPTTRATDQGQAGCSCDAGPPLGCTVLDPFAGSGTTLLVARRLGRSAIGVELNPSYCALARKRVDSSPEALFSAAAYRDQDAPIMPSSTEGAAR